MKKKDLVYLYIKQKISLNVIRENLSKGNEAIGIDALDIQENKGIVRNNASTILNELHKKGKLVKVLGRPVRFIPKDIIYELKKDNKLTNIKEEYTLEQIKSLLENSEQINLKDYDPFNILIGNKNSLLNQIGQAKAAIMYPPNGLHALIIGESGTGKTTFANIMYEYALKSKRISEKRYPFISFNCSDYFNNPQLLLSQLFGHAKGAFTGADSDKIGLVEKANGGILFLDEVHRLPPDGQEMLFFLMDKSEYHRLGETGNKRKSNVLIIAATTENPNDVLLTTFLRRIPVIIKLPTFRDKDIKERIEIIEKLFSDEAEKLKKTIYVSPEVLKALSIYEFKGNIGQLSSEVKLLCAKAFLKYLHENNKLKIEFDMLTRTIRDYIFNNKVENDIKEFLDMFTEYVAIFPSIEAKEYNNSIDTTIYDKLFEEIEKLKQEGLEQKDIDIKISNLIENYFENVINKINYNNYNKKQLYKIINKDIVDFSIEMILNISKILNPNLEKIKTMHPQEFKASEYLVRQIEMRFKVNIPKDEKGFLTILFTNNKLEKNDVNKIGIIVICHGESTASSMANVSNSLLNFDFVKAIDMPLDSEISETYDKVISVVKKINKGKGVLILVDMGSLVKFGERITKQTGIETRTIKNVSTLLVLESLRKVMYKDDDLDTIYNSLVMRQEYSSVKNINKKKKAIITICVTGQGAGIMAKDVLMDTMKKEYKDIIKIIPIDYMSIENNSDEFKKIKESYDLIACIGSLKPKIDIPYFPINQILIKDFRNNFNKFLDIKLIDGEIKVKHQKDVYDSSKEILDNYVKYLNPQFALKFIKKFIDNMDLEHEKSSNNKLIDLIVHLGCMLERCIRNDIVQFDNIDKFKEDNRKIFQKIKINVKYFEDNYNISINDDEICYIIKVIDNLVDNN